MMDVSNFGNGDFRYIIVHAEDIPTHQCRIKMTEPHPMNVMKDILVPGNRYKIKEAKVFNNSKVYPLCVTFRIGEGGITMDQSKPNYIPYTMEMDITDTETTAEPESSTSSDSSSSSE